MLLRKGFSDEVLKHSVIVLLEPFYPTLKIDKTWRNAILKQHFLELI